MEILVNAKRSIEVELDALAVIKDIENIVLAKLFSIYKSDWCIMQRKDGKYSIFTLERVSYDEYDYKEFRELTDDETETYLAFKKVKKVVETHK